MAKKFRIYIGTMLIQFQIGVNTIGLPDIYTHTMIISKSIKETELHLYQ